MNKVALTVENLSKIYFKKKGNSQLTALNKVNLEVNQGEVFGLLGPNGAGKTTFLNILAGTVIKSDGKVKVWGFDLDRNPRQVRAAIGIVPQEVNLDAFFSPRKLLELQAGLYGVTKNEMITDLILKTVSLESQANSYSRNLSGGMKRRLLIAKAMVHQPPILVLDEPTAGVDVVLRNQLLNNIKELNKSGVTIILTTHNLYEAEKLCDRIAIINKGNLVALETTQNLLDQIKTKNMTLRLSKPNKLEKINIENLRISKINDEEYTISYEKNSNKFQEFLDFLNKNDIEIKDISTDEGDLEDVFVQLTKN
tara:strand:- start:253 stop:1182 length:930 start_codon:yes stop_codon:yes gene_type:complete